MHTVTQENISPGQLSLDQKWKISLDQNFIVFIWSTQFWGASLYQHNKISHDQHQSHVFHLINKPISWAVSLDQQKICTCATWPTKISPCISWPTKISTCITWPTKTVARFHMTNTTLPLDQLWKAGYVWLLLIILNVVQYLLSTWNHKILLCWSCEIIKYCCVSHVKS